MMETVSPINNSKHYVRSLLSCEPHVYLIAQYSGKYGSALYMYDVDIYIVCGRYIHIYKGGRVARVIRVSFMLFY